MEKRWYRISALLAGVIGIMAVVAGGQVLFGKVPDYYVIDWLPIYNFLIGVLSVVVTAFLIWKRHSYALPAAVATLSLHAVVMLILIIGYRDVVATDSLMAMTIRISTWLIILGLLFFAVKRGETVHV